MSRIEIRLVRTRADKRRFLTFPWKIYKNDPLWVPPLLPQRRKITDPKHGEFFQRGEADFLTAWRDGELVGTICAAEDKAGNAEGNRRECIFGFFEYFEDLEIAWEADSDETLLRGAVIDQAALYGLVSKLRDLGLALLSVDVSEDVEPGLEPKAPTPT